MRSSTLAGRSRRWAGQSLVLVVALLSACAPPPLFSGPSQGPPATEAVWAFGDSQAGAIEGRGPGWGDRLGPDLYNSAWQSFGSGFVVPGTHTGRTVAQEAAWWLDQYPAPDRFLVMAGVNDLGAGVSVAAVLDGVAELEAIAAEAGVEVWYVGYPPFVHGAYLESHLAQRLELNDGLAAIAGDRYRSCDAPLFDDDGVWLDEADRLSPTDQVHLGDAGLAALATCMADAFGAPLVAA